MLCWLVVLFGLGKVATVGIGAGAILPLLNIPLFRRRI
jgi:hypothetical protein